MLLASPKLITTPFGFVEADISYSSLQKNSMDLYIPHQLDFSAIVSDQVESPLSESSEARKHIPVILFIHGGSFVAGDRKEYPYAQIGEAFQQRGIICAVMSYRLMKDSVWPAQPRDVARAVRWLKENIGEYGGDSEKIFVVGHSAGGHLAALISTDSTYLNEAGLSLTDISGTVAIGAMMSDGGSLSALTPSDEHRLFHSDWFFKIFGSKQNFINSLPLRHVNPFMPRMLILLADSELNDPPKEQTVKEFIALAQRCRSDVQYQILENRTHMGTVERMANPSDPAIQSIVAFISTR
ncbi:MAG: alpha/beta hydrolase [Bacteroidetes bacterium]|nr:alpha/beta hydrolase [Bacteroidota bacterium]